MLFAAAAAVAGVGSSASALTIDATFDSSITGLSNAAQVEADINYADLQFERLYSNPVTVNITYQGTLSGTNSFAGETFSNYDNMVSYSNTQSAFVNNANNTGDSDQLTAAADNWPGSQPFGNGAGWNVPDAEAKALGLLPANGAENDATIVFNFSGGYSYDPYNRGPVFDFIGVAEHEIAHALGRDAGQGSPYSPLDLYRFKSAGHLGLAAANNVYYSINGGVTNLKTFASTSDTSDWFNGAPENVFNAATYVPDSFNAVSYNGYTNALTPVDITLMDDLGYNIRPLTITWNGGNGDFLIGNDWSSSSESNVNPFNGSTLVLNSGGTASHNFSSGESFVLASNYDLGVSLQVSKGLFQMGISGTPDTSVGMLIDQDGSMTVSGSGAVNLGGKLSIGDGSGVTNAVANFSGNSTVNIGTVSGTDQTFYIGANGIGSVTQSGNAGVNVPILSMGLFTSGTGTYTLSNSAKLTVENDEFVGNQGSGVFNQTGGTNTGHGLVLGNFASGSGSYTLSNSAAIQIGGDGEEIGANGYGIFDQEGGTNTSTGGLYVGTYSGSSGTYFLEDSATLTVSGGEDIGSHGTGLFYHVGGMQTVTGDLFVGSFPSGTGSYFLANTGSLAVNGALIIGDQGLGNFNQSGATTATVSGIVDVGRLAGSTGNYLLLGTGLGAGGGEYIGDSGTGNFTINGPNLNVVTGTLMLGNTNTGTGTFVMEGSNPVLGVSSTEIVGNSGSGTFNQNSGTNTIENGGLFALGYTSNGSGTYNLSGGTLTAGTEYIGNSGFGFLSHIGGTNSCSNLYLGVAAAGQGLYGLIAPGKLTASGDEYIGYSGYGFFSQNGGTNSITIDLFVGEEAGSTGTYILSGTGTLIASTAEIIGNHSTGLFNQSGGVNEVGNTLYLGGEADGTGTYILSNSGTLTAAVGETIGNSGAGIFNQSGGLNAITGSLNLGFAGGSTGTYNLSSTGSLSASSGEIVGNSGTGIFNQSGGANTLSITAQFVIGAGGTGTYDLSGGTLTGPGFGFEYIGDGGVGTFNQSGGTHNADDMDIGYSGSTGTYILSGSGALSASSESVGVGGKGTFNQSGGSNTVGELNLAENAASKGTYNLTGGTLAAGNVYVGGNFILSGGVGVLNVSNNGLLNVSGTLAVYSAAANSINLSGGTINTAALDTNGVPGNFFWTAGTLGLTAGVTFDPEAASTSASAAFGASLLLSPGMTLNVTGIETLGGTAAFSLTIGDFGSGGNPTNNVSNDVHIGNGSTLSLLPVNLSVPILTVQSTEFIGIGGTGSFVQEGGTNTAGTSGTTGLVLGQNANDLGIYSLSSPSFPFENSFLTATGNEIVGSHGTGIFNQTGGTNTFSGGFLYVGFHVGSSGTYSLSGNGYLDAQGSEDIGVTGAGVFVQTGGMNRVDNFFTVGDQPGSTGSYTLTGGTISGGIFEYVGSSSVGTFNQGGGTNNATTLDIGENSGSTGTYVLSKGTLAAEDENIGDSGVGTFNQSGGHNDVGSDFSSLILGANSGATGTYTLSAGTASVSGFNCFEYVGYSGAGNFNQSGGLNTTSTALYIAYNSGSTGSYTLSGGLLSAPNIYVGGSSTGGGGTGVLTINGSGQLSQTGTLTVWNKGRVNLDVASTSVSSLTISGKGIVNLNGTLNINYGSPGNDPVATIVSYLKSGYNGGAWTGTSGIISTSVSGGAATPALSVGYADGNTDSGTAAGANQIVVKYTLAGDANLDGLVNFNDLVAVVQNFNKSGADWAHGDFHYGTSTNFTDLAAVVQNFNKTLPPPSGAGVELGGSTVPLVSGTDAQLPEPRGIMLIAACAGGILARRRKRRVL